MDNSFLAVIKWIFNGLFWLDINLSNIIYLQHFHQQGICKVSLNEMIFIKINLIARSFEIENWLFPDTLYSSEAWNIKLSSSLDAQSQSTKKFSDKKLYMQVFKGKRVHLFSRIGMLRLIIFCEKKYQNMISYHYMILSSFMT